MRRLLLPVLATAFVLIASADIASAACTSRKCPDQVQIDDLRARIAARCDCEGSDSRQTWARCAKQVADEAVDAGLPKACARVVRKCEAKTTCGRAGAVVCCTATRNGASAKIMKSAGRCKATVCGANPSAIDACRPDATCNPPPRRDPGTAEWKPVPEERVAAECGLDPALLRAADVAIGRPYAVVRYGKLCHEFYSEGTFPEKEDEAFSTTKTLSAVVTGMAAYQTRDLPNTGRKTGPISDVDRVDHWLDDFTFNPDAQIAHVLGMVAHNPDLSFGHKTYQYDLIGEVQINRLSDVINTAIQQDPVRLGANLEEFTQRFLYDRLGMTHSLWTLGKPDKIFAFTWQTTVREMLRVGLLMLNDGVWNDERLIASEWIYRMTHPSFEDSNTAYGYLTWLANDGKNVGLSMCAPPALHASYPHGLSESPDCNFGGTRPCTQQYDVGVWYALGLGGQVITGHRGLDLVIAAKDLNAVGLDAPDLWEAVRPAVVAADPTFHGDDAAFCAAYDASDYAPDLR
ncbi:MAG TPA: hypothetical protein VGR62_15540 [Candidatus Binatia bacterium]|jgi:hypothetical protein|nr:hypothetical protein [Candidatus Binatia bacterium]